MCKDFGDASRSGEFVVGMIWISVLNHRVSYAPCYDPTRPTATTLPCSSHQHCCSDHQLCPSFLFSVSSIPSLSHLRRTTTLSHQSIAYHSDHGLLLADSAGAGRRCGGAAIGQGPFQKPGETIAYLGGVWGS